jgi:hypothetical protein
MYSRIWPGADTAVIPVSRSRRKSTTRAKKGPVGFVFSGGMQSVDVTSKIPVSACSSTAKTAGSKSFDFCAFWRVPARKVLKILTVVTTFQQQRFLNHSERYAMQTTSRKSEKKSQNRKTNGLFEATSLREQIEARAHEIYLSRGAEPGHELDDWLQAEREIMGWV